MAATHEDILIEQGATFEKTITVKDAAGAPVPITTWTGRGVVKTLVTDVTPIAEFDFDFATLGATGKVVVSLDATTTGAIPTTGTKYSAYTKYVYEIELVNGAKVYRAANGNVNVSPSATQ